MPPTEGDTYTAERTFTEADVRRFAAVTGDDQTRHTDPGPDGRLLVHGLLTGSLLTEVSGDIEMLASEMSFEFHRPVYTGDTVVCEWTNESVTERADGWHVEARVVCRRVSGGEAGTVLTATVAGLVRE
ncbi:MULTISPECIES: MaoC/PaaZ C-terminal domain-containing protein [Salinibaculum]|uniref:MaoC/PaaZ C-terminal domain-containing protein n=1 Tax=Salinibaculum TaxID=2732368 RepID=UPI0030CC6481